MNELENPLHDAIGAADTAVELVSDVHVPELLLSQRSLIQKGDGVSLVLIARINCPHFCNLVGTTVLLESSGGEEREVAVTAFNGVENETDEILVTTDSAAGTYSWTAVYRDAPHDGPAHAEVSSTVSIEYQPHTLSLAVWDIPVAAIVEEPVALKVGAKCNNNCHLSGSVLRIRNERGELVATEVLGADPWQGTGALFWSNASFEAPAVVGTYKYVASIGEADGHAQAETSFSLLVIEKPRNAIAVDVIDEETEKPVARARISCHPYTRLTDESGHASIPAVATKGSVRITAEGYLSQQFNLAVINDTNLFVMLKRMPENLGDF